MTEKARYWLLKPEPGCYSIEDLKSDGTNFWSGVRNYQARNFLKEMKNGDLCLFYHSNTDPSAAVGICEVVKEAYPDPSQFDAKDEHYDADSDPRNPRWMVVDVKYVSTFAKPVSITDMRKNPKLGAMKLLEKGSRLSVLPVEKEEFAEGVGMGGD